MQRVNSTSLKSVDRGDLLNYSSFFVYTAADATAAAAVSSTPAEQQWR